MARVRSGIALTCAPPTMVVHARQSRLDRGRDAAAVGDRDGRARQADEVGLERDDPARRLLVGRAGALRVDHVHRVALLARHRGENQDADAGNRLLALAQTVHALVPEAERRLHQDQRTAARREVDARRTWIHLAEVRGASLRSGYPFTVRPALDETHLVDPSVRCVVPRAARSLARCCLATLALLVASAAHERASPPQARARYVIAATLDPGGRDHRGRSRSRSPTPAARALERVYLHLYPNRFRHDGDEVNDITRMHVYPENAFAPGGIVLEPVSRPTARRSPAASSSGTGPVADPRRGRSRRTRSSRAPARS